MVPTRFLHWSIDAVIVIDVSEKDILWNRAKNLLGQSWPCGATLSSQCKARKLTATIDRLRELYPAGRFEVRRFRPNIVVAPSIDERDFIENRWLGRSLRVGAEVRMHLIDPCPRCVVTTLAQGDLPRDLGILRTMGQHNAVPSITLAPGIIFPAVAGIYAIVLEEGMICRENKVWLE